MQQIQLTDRELIHQYMGGEERAFEVLLFRHKNKVYTTIYLFVQDKVLADDIFQETFVKVIDTLRHGRYNEEGKFGQWASRIAYNLCVDHYRVGKRQPQVTTHEYFEDLERIADEKQDSMTLMVKQEVYTDVRRLIDQLPVEQREVLILRHYADLSFKEIAELTRVSINTALGRMRYALANIRKMMTRQRISLR